MRKDRQHKEFRTTMLGMEVYFGSEKGDFYYWRDLTLAMARVMQRHKPELRSKSIGCATGATLYARFGAHCLPEPYRSEVAAEYILIREDEAIRRARADGPEAPQLPAFGHDPAL